MPTIHQHNGSLLIEVPEGAHSFKISTSLKNQCSVNNFVYDFLNSTIVFRYTKDHQGFLHLDGLPPGKLKIIGIALQVTEEQAREVVDDVEIHEQVSRRGYKRYDGAFFYYTAIEALHSLVRSLGMQPETTLIIFKSK